MVDTGVMEETTYDDLRVGDLLTEWRTGAIRGRVLRRIRNVGSLRISNAQHIRQVGLVVRRPDGTIGKWAECFDTKARIYREAER